MLNELCLGIQTPFKVLLRGMNGDNITDKQLEQNLWVLRHKPQLIKAGTIALLAGNIIIFGWVFFNLGDYLFGRGPKERQNLATQSQSAIPYAELNKALTPASLSVADTLLFGGREDKYDLGAEIANSNEAVWAEFEYQFIGGNFETKPVKDFILPKSRKFLLQLGFDASARPVNARLVFKSFTWHRLSRHDYPDYEKYKNDHLAMTASEVTFGHSTLSGGALNQVAFTLTNFSAYHFWQVPVEIILFRGDQVVGFNLATLEKLRSLEARATTVTWAEGLPAVTRVDVQPDVNILDPGIYMP